MVVVHDPGAVLMTTERIVEHCNISKRLVLAADGALGDIKQLLDADGDETLNVDDALFAVVCWRDDSLWSSIVLSDFQDQRVH